MKMLRLVLVLLVTCLFAGVTYAKNTMVWEMLPNESLVELAAKFYPKSGAMQRAFVLKTQQLNQDTQVYTNAHARYPTATKIVIPTLESLSVKGIGAKKYKRQKIAKKSQKKSDTASENAELVKAQAQLAEKRKALDASLEKQKIEHQSLEAQVNELKKQLNQAEPAVKQTTANKTPS